MNLQSRRQGKLWTLLCGLILLTAVVANQAVSQGASLDTMPLPVGVPIPDTVFHTDNFGNSVAMDGDTLVVGAPWTDVNGEVDQGMVYIFTRDPNDPTAFTLLKTITGSDSAKNYSFGWSVDIQGDTLVVGTAESGSFTTFVGTVYIFERNQGGDNNWGEVKKLTRDETVYPLNYFGRTLALYGDTLAVGAALGLGKVFMFERNQDGANQWGNTQILDGGIPITTTPKSASFGSVIEFDGETLAILAPKAGLTPADLPPGSPVPPKNFESAAFIYRQENGQWILDAKLFNSDIALDNLDPFSVVFGSIATLALNGDTLFVGNPDGMTDGVQAGKVYVYQRGAGTPPDVGLPGAWGEITTLTPDDGVEDDHFGWSLYAVDDGLFVGSEKQGVGKVYFFRNPAGAASNSETEPQASLAWSGVYSFSTSTGLTSTDFGYSIDGSGNSVVMGDPSANQERGGMVTYPKDALFVGDPNATPTATPITPTPPPTAEPEPCDSVPQTLPSQVFLPSVMGNAEGTGRAAVATQPNVGTAIVTETLSPGCMIDGPNGVKIAAVDGAITQTVALTLETTAAPPEALPEGVAPTGDFLRITSAANQFVEMETPFVIGIPVPANVDSAHLALAHLLPATRTLDSKVSGNFWHYIPGVYDPSSKLFLARLPFLLEEGVTFALVVHPDFDSPTNQPPAIAQAGVQPAAQAVLGEFKVYCIGFTFANRSDCTDAMQVAAKTMLDEIYQRMTDPAIFGFPKKLRLLDSGSQFIVSDTISVTALTASYVAYIQGPKDALCTDAAGYYEPHSGAMVLCASAGETLDAGDKETLIHEFFHAVEFTYPEVGIDRLFGYDEPWLIEGMATAAEKSYPDTKMQRTPYFGLDNLQKVDQALTTGIVTDEPIDEYLAQDFWVYVGASQGEDLGYLGTLLALAGANHVGVDRALQTLYGKSLGEFYWGFVKNQTIENALNVGESPGDFCNLSATSLTTGTPVGFPASETFYPFGTQAAYDRLPPLTAKVIEIDPGGRVSLPVEIEYEGCVGLQDPLAKASCVAAAQQTLKTKIYVEDEVACDEVTPGGATETGFRFLTPIDPSKRYFVVVANADRKEDHGYFIFIE